MIQPKIRVEHLTIRKRLKAREPPVEVLQDVSCDIAAAEILTVIGPSGSGKSTFLRALNRLDEPTRGDVLLDGHSVRTIPPPELRRRVSLVFQIPTLFPGTVAANLWYGPRLRGIRANTGDEVAVRLLAQVELTPAFLSRDVTTLSVGQQQRVGLARALANAPEVVLLDEVTAPLDLANVLAVEALIHALNQTLGLTIVWVTHNLDQAKRLGHRTLLLVDGRSVEVGETQALFQAPHDPLTQRFLAGELLAKEGSHV